jgi:hypothetical protein
VVRHVAVKLRVERFDACHVDEKIGQFVHTRRKALIAACELRIIAKQIGVALADHAAARPGRDDDVVELLEFLERFFGQVTGQRAIAGVVGGLPAAGLRGRHHDVVTGLFQQLEH